MVSLVFCHFAEYFKKSEHESFSTERVLNLWKDAEAFEWFLDNVCSVVVGLSAAEKEKYIKEPKEWLTRSLEAFSLLCFENYYDMVLTTRDGKVSRPVWMADGRGRKRNQGWNMEGIRRYNQHLQYVEENRRLYPHVDKLYLKKKRKEREHCESSRLKQKKRSRRQEKKDWKLL